jgi:isoleucyl-tRNA synthetase
VDLSAFYLDILKDRLYTSPAASAARRSAQTVMHAILDTMARLMAPILAFTADEIWRFMPARADRPESVHFAAMPEKNDAWLDPELAERWHKLLEVRAEVTKVLESARAEKVIGHSLDAQVTLTADDGLRPILEPYAEELCRYFIVSSVRLVDAAPEGSVAAEQLDGLQIQVAAAPGDKCQRCWVHDPSVGRLEDHPEICARCHGHLAEIELPAE